MKFEVQRFARQSGSSFFSLMSYIYSEPKCYENIHSNLDESFHVLFCNFSSLSEILSNVYKLEFTMIITTLHVFNSFEIVDVTIRIVYGSWYDMCRIQHLQLDYLEVVYLQTLISRLDL